MKILFIAGQSIKSNSSVTMMNIAYIKGLIEEGHEVKVITSKLPEEHISIDTNLKIPDKVIVQELDLGSAYNKLSSKREDNSIGFNIKHKIKNILRKIYYSISVYDSQKSWVKNVDNFEIDRTEYDLVISSSDPKHTHLFAEKLIKTNKIKCNKWIQLWGDPMFHDITRTNNFLKNRLFKEEYRLLSLADKIIYVSPFTAEEQKKTFTKFKDKIKYVVIPYFKTDDSKPNNIEKDEITFGYYGDYNENVRNINPLYDVAKDNNYKLIIRGNSNKEVMSINNVNVGKRITMDELERLELNTDVFIHLCNKKGTQIPAKVYYYSGTQKPILFILDGESKKIRQFFEKYDRYIFCENNKEDINRAMQSIINKQYDSKKTRIVEELSPKYISRKFIEIIAQD